MKGFLDLKVLGFQGFVGGGGGGVGYRRGVRRWCCGQICILEGLFFGFGVEGVGQGCGFDR